MRFLKRLAERYLGVPGVGPGEDTKWTFDNDWPAWAPEWVLVLCVPLLLAVIVAVYWRDAKSAGWKTRLGLVALRVSQIGLLIVFLSNVTLQVDGTELPAVVVLIDRSASMKLDDHYSDKAVDKATKDLLRETDTKEPSRMNLVKALLTRRDGEFLRELQEYHRLHIYEFSDDSRRFGSGEYLTGDDVEQAIPRIRKELQPDGSITNHRAALKRVLDDFSGSPPAAIILLTDGITTSSEEDRLSAAAQLAVRQSVQVFVVGIGSADPARDLQLSGILAPDVAYLNNPVTFSADLRAFGVDAKQITLQLRRKGEVEPLVKRRIDVPDSGKSERVEITYTPTEKGEGVEFIFEAVPLTNETNTANNVQFARISIRGKTLKVLLADSLPRYEFRYVKHLLERESTIQLHTILQEADSNYIAEDATAKALGGRFPIDRGQLLEYDAIIFGDVDISLIPDDVLTNLREFVRAGGSLIMIAGPYYNPMTYNKPALKTLLPFELDGAKTPPDGDDIDAGFRPRLTASGRGNPMFRLSMSREASEAVWAQLPEMYWILELGELKPGAQVFLEHPARQTRPADDGKRRPLPVVLMHRVGAGKVLYHTVDELWRMRRLVGDLYYARYWVQTLRAMSRSKLLGQSREAELESDRREYESGQKVQLSLRFFDPKRVPTDTDGALVVVEREGTEIGRVKLKRVPHLQDVFVGELPGEEIPQIAEGSYRAWVVSPFFEKGTPSTTFHIAPPQKELQLRSIQSDQLQGIADKTGGKYISLDKIAELPAQIPRGTPTPLNKPANIPLWNRWELMLLFAGLITAEWLLRKRLRLI